MLYPMITKELLGSTHLKVFSGAGVEKAKRKLT